jgi:1,4-dihydroxy-2-naphthoate octaprenyltransferase
MMTHLLRLSRPLYLVHAALTYLLGASIADYLGQPVDMAAFWLGLGGTLFVHASAYLLAEVFRPGNEPLVADESPAERQRLRNAALWLSIALLAAAAVLLVALVQNGRVPAVLWFILCLNILLALAYGVPPLRLVTSGFGELTLAVMLGSLSPATAFLLQAGEYHRILGLIAFAMTLLSLAYLLALNFPTYATDLKYLRQTLLMRLGWERAIPLHHGLLGAVYLLLALLPVLGFSWGLVWPAFLGLPFAILQILWLRNVSRGAPPVWKFLTTNATALFMLTAYLLTFSFFLR